MALPTTYLIDYACIKSDESVPHPVIFAGLGVDALAVTALCVGILGALSLIALPKAACYAMIAVGTITVAGWVAMVIASKGAVIGEIGDVFSSLCSKPKDIAALSLKSVQD